METDLSSFGQGGVKAVSDSESVSQSSAPGKFPGNVMAGNMHRAGQGRRCPFWAK